MNNSLQVRVVEHRFAPRDVIAGDAAVDFVNTVNGRDQSPSDWLDGYARLLEWAALTKLLPEKTLRALARKSEREPAAAARALARAKVLREALFALINALIAGKAPPSDALTLLREHWIEGVRAHELRYEDGRIVPGLGSEDPDLDLIASVVAYRMIEHVLPLSVDRLRICAGPNCAWLFIDSSKAGRRRWCDMAVCGNAAKSRRFYSRSRRRRAR